MTQPKKTKAPPTKTTSPEQGPSPEEVLGVPMTTQDAIVGRLDRIIDLLTEIAGSSKKIPFQGIDLSRFCKE